MGDPWLCIVSRVDVSSVLGLPEACCSYRYPHHPKREWGIQSEEKVSVPPLRLGCLVVDCCCCGGFEGFHGDEKPTSAHCACTATPDL